MNAVFHYIAMGQSYGISPTPKDLASFMSLDGADGASKLLDLIDKQYLVLALDENLEPYIRMGSAVEYLANKGHYIKDYQAYMAGLSPLKQNS